MSPGELIWFVCAPVGTFFVLRAVELAALRSKKRVNHESTRIDAKGKR